MSAIFSFPGRQISEAILLAQELMHEYHRDKKPQGVL